MPISRGMMERQLRMGGGIMNIVPREEAFLGGLKKAIKGVAKGIGSFIKSDAGKMALTAGALYGLGGGTFFGKSLPGIAGTGFKAANILPNIKNLPFMSKFVGSVGLGKLLGGGMPQPQVGSFGVNTPAIRSYLKEYFTNLNPQRDNEEDEEYEARINQLVESNMVEYMSDGGRIGYRFGGGYQGSDAKTGKGGASKGRSTSARDRAMGSGGKQRSGTNTSSIGGGNNRRDDSPQQTITRRDRFDTSPENIVGLPTFAEFGLPGSKGLMDEQMLAKVYGLEDLEKEGAEKGFFGMNKELKSMQKFFDFAKKQKAAGKSPSGIRESAKIGQSLYGFDLDLVPKDFLQTEKDFEGQISPLQLFEQKAEGGRIGYARGDSAEDNAMQAAGVMGLPLNQNPAGITELDLRETGGFIPPVGVKEKADDIPAMLSNNEFVFTADAVRGMGDGDVNKGAQRMYDMMKRLENGGRV